MADETTNGHSEWSAADFADLNQAIGMLGPQAVEIIPGKPPITLDLSGIAVLTAMGRWGNPLMRARGKATDAAVAQLQDADADTDLTDRLAAAIQASTEWFDCVLQAVLVHPPYQSLASLQAEGAKPGHLHVLAFTMEQRTAVQLLVMGGADALARFRRDPAGFVAGSPVSGVPPEPGAGVPPAAAVPSERVAERGDLASDRRVGSRATRGSDARARDASATDGAPAGPARGAA